MPEPLCSDSLYQMLMDALNVQISGDVDGNARLMLGVLDCLPAVNQVRYTLHTHTQQIAAMIAAIVAATVVAFCILVMLRYYFFDIDMTLTKRHNIDINI